MRGNILCKDLLQIRDASQLSLAHHAAALFPIKRCQGLYQSGVFAAVIRVQADFVFGHGPDHLLAATIAQGSGLSSNDQEGAYNTLFRHNPGQPARYGIQIIFGRRRVIFSVEYQGHVHGSAALLHDTHV